MTTQESTKRRGRSVASPILRNFPLSVCILLALMITARVEASFLAPVSVSATHEDGNALATNVVNHNGLDNSGQHTSSFATNNHWRDQVDPATNTVQLTFDLGARFDLDSIRIWNYNEAAHTSRGVSGLDVSFSNDGVSFSGSQTVSPTQASGNSSYTGADYALSATNARYVRFDVNSRFANDNNFTGISEVRFNTTTSQIAINSIYTNLAGDDPNFGPEDLNGGGFTSYEGQIRSSSSEGYFNKLWRDNEGISGVNISGAELTFDLGTDQDVNLIKVWNYNESGQTVRSIKNLEIWASDDDSTYTQVGGTWTLDQARDAAIASDQTVLALPQLNTRYVQFRPLTVYGNSNNFYGIGEVQFYNVVPEPATMSLLAIGGIAMLRRRRK